MKIANKKYRRALNIILIILFLIGVSFYVVNRYYIIKFTSTSLNNNIYGVIDGNITEVYDNTVYDNAVIGDGQTKTHGDKMLLFINNLYSDYKIYYYNAEAQGKITDKTIIAGLEWMKENGIKKVNISLSSKKSSEELQTWILENKDEVTIYASYSNEKNTYDYPAMYEGVIGSTGIETASLKEDDVEYLSNEIVDIKNLEYYKGNSYLSIISVFR